MVGTMQHHAQLATYIWKSSFSAQWLLPLYHCICINSPLIYYVCLGDIFELPKFGLNEIKTTDE